MKIFRFIQQNAKFQIHQFICCGSLWLLGFLSYRLEFLLKKITICVRLAVNSCRSFHGNNITFEKPHFIRIKYKLLCGVSNRETTYTCAFQLIIDFEWNIIVDMCTSELRRCVSCKNRIEKCLAAWSERNPVELNWLFRAVHFHNSTCPHVQTHTCGKERKNIFTSLKLKIGFAIISYINEHWCCRIYYTKQMLHLIHSLCFAESEKNFLSGWWWSNKFMCSLWNISMLIYYQRRPEWR